MLANIEQQKRLASLADATVERFEAHDRAALHRFVRSFYQRMDMDELAARDDASLGAAAFSHWQLGQRRAPRQTLIRIFNPGLEAQGFQSPYTIVEIVNDDMPFLVDSAVMEINRQGLALHALAHPIFSVRRDAAGNLLELSDAGQTAPRESFMYLEIERIDDGARLVALEQALLKVFKDVRAAVEDWPKMRERMQSIEQSLGERPPELDAGLLSETRAYLQWLLDDHFTFLGYRCHDLLKHQGEDALRLTPLSGLGILRSSEGAGLSASFAALPPVARAYAHEKDLLLLSKSNSRSTVHRPGYLDYVGIKRYDEQDEVCGEHRFLGLYTHAAYRSAPREVPILRDKIAQVDAAAALPAGSHDAKALEQILDDYPRDELLQIDAQQLSRFALGILQLGEQQRLRLFIRRDRFERSVSCLIYAPREQYSTDLRRKWQAILLHAFNGNSAEFNVHLSESPLARVLIIVRTTPGRLADYDARALEQQLALAGRRWDELLQHVLMERLGEAEGNALYRRFEGAFPVAYREDFSAAQAVDDVQALARAGQSGRIQIRLYRPDGMPPDHLRFKIAHCGESIALSDSLPMLEHMGLRVLEERPYRIGGIERQHDGDRSASGHDANKGVAADAAAGVQAIASDVEVSGADAASASPQQTDGIAVETAAQNGGVTGWIHDFGLAIADPGIVVPIGADEFAVLRRSFEDSFARMFAGEIESDDFNRLVIAARLSADEVLILRAYAKYFRQAGFALSQSFIETTLASHADIARMLVVLFKLRFDPLRGDEAAAQRQTHAVEQALEAVANLNEDRVLRQYLALIQATTRCNYWRRDAAGAARSFLSFKFDPARIPGLPEPKPAYEIFVYSTRFEGVHLRGSKVARGGLRWSDRPEDFRTEVLGLLKAQMVKNAVIVPGGSKGGFVLKRAPAGDDRDALMAEGLASYRDYLRGLLDLTDNLIDDAIVPPPQVRRHDEDDPYLVVAADKGTARFSDHANAVAREYNFWLADAFASGGSAGYDHKAMGITARGAWESVKRHFRELGVDIQRQPFSVVGIGDMSGDVFGNGMLLSQQIRLIAAFDHRHIFIDPAPDAAASFVERERLFRLPRSSWADYHSALISSGGGVWPRSAKSIQLSTQACAALGVAQADASGTAMAPSEVISAILRAPVDLLYNGGIGTYVKAASESSIEVGDRANDALRVNGGELRCKVVGEGGNLGFTQRGRIEYALTGGRNNTDAIDNSAGVDASDHEVNIKILLGLVRADGVLNTAQRDALLASMSDEVAQLVLRDNYFQPQSISLSQRAGVLLLDAQHRFIVFLEKQGRLDRELEFLPSEESFDERRRQQRGLTRPELAVLLAYAKMWLCEELLRSSLPDDEWVATALSRYFPTPLREVYASYLPRHPLRREIIATHVVNSMINRVGSTFVHQLMETANARSDEIVRAYLLSREVFGLVPLWESIEKLDNQVPDHVQSEMLGELRRLILRATRWFLRWPHLHAPMDESIMRFAPAVRNLFAQLDVLLDEAARTALHTRAAHFVDMGVPLPIAQHVVAYERIYAALDVIEVAGSMHFAVEEVAQVLFRLSQRLGLEDLRRSINALSVEGHWHTRAKLSLREDLASLQRELSMQLMREHSGLAGADAKIDAWFAQHAAAVQRAAQIVEEVRVAPNADIAMLSVALRELRALI